MTAATGGSLRPATVVLCAAIGGTLAADVPLMRRGHAPVTAALQHPAGVAFLLLLGGHVAGLLGRYDLFRTVGWWAERLEARAVAGCHVP